MIAFTMSQTPNKKYSKISSALKYYFLTNLYYHCLDLKQAADKCKINYSTAKIILRDLSNLEKKCVRRLVREKEKDEKQGMNIQETCSYTEADNKQFLNKQCRQNLIQIISRVGYNFFACSQKK